MKKKSFEVVLIKPSHYDDDGYVIQWYKSSIPSNTLAVLYGLTQDCQKRKVLGDDVDIQLSCYDETNTRIQVQKIAKRFERNGNLGLIALVGVQSNQFPRAMDIARQFRKKNIDVCIGGFHVSGCLSMLDDTPPEIQEAQNLGISLFAGEAEGRLEELIKDSFHKQIKPLYNYLADLPAVDNRPLPFLPASLLKKTMGTRASFDAGRGCPFQCSFCTIINVQGRKSRNRTADDVEKLIRRNLAQGVRNYFISDDNFARNQEWQSIFDRLIMIQEQEKIKLRLIIQVDTLCHKIPGFIAKAAEAGVTRVFIGMESINPKALIAAQKRQNKIEEYQVMLESWHSVGVLTYAGYILGFPTDTPQSILEDIKTIQRDVPVDLLEFFILTPLPGSEDHQKLYRAKVDMDTDLNKYDVVHTTVDHPQMTRDEWLGIYQQAWKAYYSKEHVQKVIARSKQWGFNPREMMLKLFSFSACPQIEGIHPLEGGFFRCKYRKDRRPGFAIENPIVFYSKFILESLTKLTKYFLLYRQYRAILKTVA